MVQEAQKHAVDDAKRKEMVDARNAADQMIYQAEKTLRDMGEKVSGSDRAEVESQINDLHQGKTDNSVSKEMTLEEDIRRLRSAIVTILRRSGTLRLPELHALLHHHGYRIQSEHPVKALSDACSYEVEKGRLTKRARGTYGPAGRHRPRDSFERSPCGPLDHA